MIDKIIRLFFGRKCSICNQKMWRSLDDGRMYPNISTSYHCVKCKVWIFEKNFNWWGSTYRIGNRYKLSIWSSSPTKCFIEGSWEEGHLWTIPINRIYWSAEDIETVNKTINHLLLLS
jgi:hypothetical protein